MLKTEIINRIIKLEGGYVNDPSDSGGETNFGITKAVARANGYNGPMSQMPQSVAFRIYENRYWEPLNLDKIIVHSALIAEELMDTAVNMGVGRAAEFLQRSLNALNNGGTLYPDIKVDLDVGGATIAAYNAFMRQRGTTAVPILLRALNCLQGAFYIELAEKRQKDEKFLAGWLLNRVL